MDKKSHATYKGKKYVMIVGEKDGIHGMYTQIIIYNNKHNKKNSKDILYWYIGQ